MQANARRADGFGSVASAKGTSFALRSQSSVAVAGRTAEGQGKVYSARSPWKEDAGRLVIVA